MRTHSLKCLCLFVCSCSWASRGSSRPFAHFGKLLDIQELSAQQRAACHRYSNPSWQVGAGIITQMIWFILATTQHIFTSKSSSRTSVSPADKQAPLRSDKIEKIKMLNKSSAFEVPVVTSLGNLLCHLTLMGRAGGGGEELNLE